KLKNIYDSEKIWQKLDNYYTLEISPNIRNSEEKQILETNIYNLIKKSEQLGGLLLKNNNIANPDKNNYIPENGNVFFINNNFLNFYKNINHDFKMIDDHSDKINVFIPPRLQYQKSEIQ
ncbi:bacteriocin-associated integral membrane family protein, partial [Staphylococcus aureus]|nr:bacteriocin-associated integral membrane family protein [Staphylococcus aureus]